MGGCYLVGRVGREETFIYGGFQGVMKGVVNPTDGGGAQPRPFIAPLVHASVLQQLLVEGIQVFACEFQQGLVSQV